MDIKIGTISGIETFSGIICENGTQRSRKFLYTYSDGGRAASKRPRQKNDCTVRAYAIAFGIPYDPAYDTLSDAGRKCSSGFDINEFLNNHPRAEKISFPAVKGRERMNPMAFYERFGDKGTYICRTAGHVYAVVNGVVHDTHAPRGDRCIYAAWKIK